MLDIGWSELLLIGVVALIVVGPKDLPMMLRSPGGTTARARAMARESSRAMEDAAKETGVNEAADNLKALTSKKSLGLDALERATEKFENWDPKFPSQRTPGSEKLEADPGLAADLDAAETAAEPDPSAPEPAAPDAPADPDAPVPAVPVTSPVSEKKDEA